MKDGKKQLTKKGGKSFCIKLDENKGFFFRMEPGIKRG